jgi:hypothetical protein
MNKNTRQITHDKAFAAHHAAARATDTNTAALASAVASLVPIATSDVTKTNWDTPENKNRPTGLQVESPETRMKMLETIETAVERLSAVLRSGRSVREDVVMDSRLSVGDTVAQGDVFFDWRDPSESANVKDALPVIGELRLVPGADDGGNHILEGGPGVFATAVPKDMETLVGPTIIVKAGYTANIRHDGSGKHGPVQIVGPACITTGYPAEWERIQQAERRARD